MQRLAISTVFVLFLAAMNCQAQENWPRFRGINGNGVVPADLPDKWSENDYLWQIDLPGVGSSSPVIWDGNLVITSCDAKTAELTVQCLDAETGKQMWAKSFESSPYRLHARNSFAASTPALDADHIYFAMANPQHTLLVALDYSGDVVWRRDFGTWTSQHGFSMSPVVLGDKVIFVNSQQAQQVRPGQTPGTSEVIAVSRRTGNDVWRTQLKATRACYALPCLIERESGQELIGTNTGDGFYSINPTTGRMNWSVLPFRMRTVASTITAGGLVLGSNGSGGGGNYLVAIQPNGDGADKVYEITQSANYVPTPIAVGDLLFLFGDKGIATCVDLKTGSLNWRERLARGFSGSPVSNGKNLYVMGEQGTVFVVRVAREFENVHQIELGQTTRATPAIYNEKIYFRTDSKLFCLGNHPGHK